MLTTKILNIWHPLFDQIKCVIVIFLVLFIYLFRGIKRRRENTLTSSTHRWQMPEPSQTWARLALHLCKCWYPVLHANTLFEKWPTQCCYWNAVNEFLKVNCTISHTSSILKVFVPKWIIFRQKGSDAVVSQLF